MSAEVKARAKAAILGALVADAATAPLHWVYDVKKIEGLLGDENAESAPEFFKKPVNAFYKISTGSNSPYGHEGLALLKAVAEAGALDTSVYIETIVKHFNENPDVYRNHSIKDVLANHEAGKSYPETGSATDTQANCFSKIAVIVGRYAGKEELKQRVEEAVRVQQNNDDAVKYALATATILEKVILGADVMAALQMAAADKDIAPDVVELINKALATVETPLTESTFSPPDFLQKLQKAVLDEKHRLPAYTVAVWCNGPSCSNPGALANSLIALAAGKTYTDIVRDNIKAGGDNCSRSMYVGAVSAAQGGLGSIPAEWKSKASLYAEFEALVDKALANL